MISSDALFGGIIAITLAAFTTFISLNLEAHKNPGIPIKRFNLVTVIFYGSLLVVALGLYFWDFSRHLLGEIYQSTRELSPIIRYNFAVDDAYNWIYNTGLLPLVCSFELLVVELVKLPQRLTIRSYLKRIFLECIGMTVLLTVLVIVEEWISYYLYNYCVNLQIQAVIATNYFINLLIGFAVHQIKSLIRHLKHRLKQNSSGTLNDNQ